MTAVPAGTSRSVELRNAALLVVAVAALAAAFGMGGNTGPSPRLPDAPALPAPAASCKADAARAVERANEAARVAQARLARYPFAPEEGLRALALLAEARDCLRRAGRSEDDALLAARAAASRERIAGDYRDHLARVRHALEQGELARAADDVRYLRALLGEQDGAFARELRALELEVMAEAPVSGRGQP